MLLPVRKLESCSEGWMKKSSVLVMSVVVDNFAQHVEDEESNCIMANEKANLVALPRLNLRSSQDVY